MARESIGASSSACNGKISVVASLKQTSPDHHHPDSVSDSLKQTPFSDSSSENGWLLFQAERHLVDQLISKLDDTPSPSVDNNKLVDIREGGETGNLETDNLLETGNLDGDNLVVIRGESGWPCLKKPQEVPVPTFDIAGGCVTWAVAPKDHFTCASELYNLEPHKPEFAVHLIRRDKGDKGDGDGDMAFLLQIPIIPLPALSVLPETNSSEKRLIDENQNDDHSNITIPAYISRLISDVTIFHEIVPAMSNVKQAFFWILQTSQVRFREARLADELRLNKIRTATTSELMSSPVALSCEAAYNDLFRTFFIIAFPRVESGEVEVPLLEYRLFPLHEVYDLGMISLYYKQMLHDHFQEIKGDISPESFSDFSFLTAQYVLKKVCAKLKWVPHYFKPMDNSSEDSIHEFALELCSHPFTAFQLLRAVTMSVKNGFEVVMNIGERSQTAQASSPPDALETLCAVEVGCKGMTVTKKIGIRMTFGWVKHALLDATRVVIEFGRPVNPRSLIDWNYGSFAKGRESKRLGAADETPKETPMSKGDLIKLQSNCEMLIISLKRFKEAANDSLMVLSQECHGTPNVLDSAYDLANQGLRIERWTAWNYDLSFFGEVTKQVVSGNSSRGSLQALWKQAMEANDLTEEEAWYFALGAGVFFKIDLPSALVDSLDSEGFATCGLDIDMDDTEPFLLLACQRDLSWDWMVRLKDLYRLRPTWTKAELAVWLGPSLRYRNAPTLDHLVSEHLRPVREGSLLLESATLQLERHD